jgi:sugar lactone lactonase YvrE
LRLTRKSSHIGVAFLDGSSTKILVDGMQRPNVITLDRRNGRLYWVDAKAETIGSVTIAVKDRRVVQTVKHPFRIAVLE